MRKFIPTESQLPLPMRALSALALALSALNLAAALPLAAQTSPAQPAAAHHKSAHPHKKSSAAHAKTAPEQSTPAVPAPVVPPAPELPAWPVNDSPTPATVTWDSRGLRIEAANSSLDQILHDVATTIGARIDGMPPDQRIFGTYGPGPARDVLSKLLDSSSYNFVFFGDQGSGAPRQIVLSSPSVTGAQTSSTPTPASDEDNDVEEQPQQPPPPQSAPPPLRGPFGPGSSRFPQQPQPNQPNQ